MAIIFCAWAIISGVIMLGSMVFTGAGACDARVPRISELCAGGRHRRRSIDGGESSISSEVSTVHRPSQDATEFGVPIPG